MRNPLSETHPELAGTWDPERNAPLTPDGVSAGSNRRAWWICPACGHAWRAAVCDRTRADGPTGCPACANRVVIAGC